MDIAIIKGADIIPYNDALDGFESACGNKTSLFNLNERNGRELLENIVGERPGLVLAIGLDALSVATSIKDIPVVYVMVSNPLPLVSGSRNITGVSMDVAAKRQLDALIDAAPNVRRIGLIYDPEKTRDLFVEAREAALASGIALKAKEARNTGDVLKALNEIKTEIDAFWMLPDTTVITPETLEYMFLVFLDNRIPVLAFSKKYVEMGALLALSIEPFDLGRQACEIAKKQLAGIDTPDTQVIKPRKATVHLNQIQSEYLNLSHEKEAPHGAVKKILQ